MQQIARALCLLILMLGGGAVVSCSPSDNTEELLIYSPHGADIQYEFTRGFEAWHLAKYHTAVHVKFIDVGGGTGVIINKLRAQRENGSPPDADMMFGGGSAVFDDLAKKGFLEPADPPVPAEVLARIPERISGAATRRTMADLAPPAATTASAPAMAPAGPPIWYAATTSYFGIVVNKQRAAELGIPLPVTWEDVAGPEWLGNLSIADPSKSGSVKTCLEMVLQQYGWEKGWPILVKMYANAETVKPGGSQPADEIASAAAAGGVVIDFFGRIAVVKCGPEIAQFIVPKGCAQLDSDPIAVLAGAKHKVLASHMLEFVLSPAGQRLWTHRAGTPNGPVRKALGRMSLLKELYDNESQYMTDPFNPFTAGGEVKIRQQEQTERTVILGDLVKCALVDNHEILVQARTMTKALHDPPELMAIFDTLPFRADELGGISKQFSVARVMVDGKLQNEPAAATEDRQSKIRKKWTEMYRNLFNEIIAKAKSMKAS